MYLCKWQIKELDLALFFFSLCCISFVLNLFLNVEVQHYIPGVTFKQNQQLIAHWALFSSFNDTIVLR